MTTIDLTVTNPNDVIYGHDEAPLWRSDVYADLGNFLDRPIVTVDCGAFAGDALVLAVDLA